MKILFDQGTPVPLREHLRDHFIETVYERGWSTLSNGKLLDAAEKDGFQLLITTDQNLRFQQNLSQRKLAVLVLLSASWPRIQLRAKEIKAAIDTIAAGDYKEILM